MLDCSLTTDGNPFPIRALPFVTNSVNLVYAAEVSEAETKKSLKNQARKAKATKASSKKRREYRIATFHNPVLTIGSSQEAY